MVRNLARRSRVKVLMVRLNESDVKQKHESRLRSVNLQRESVCYD